jgi:hypothetical protein
VTALAHSLGSRRHLLRPLAVGKENIRVTALAHSLGSRRHLLGSLTVGKENTAKSGPVVRLRFLHNAVILNYFRVKFVKKLSKGLIDINSIVPTISFSIL